MLLAEQVQVAKVGSGMVPEETIDICCGDAQQVLQWIGYSACARLSYMRGAFISSIQCCTRTL